MLLPPVRAVLSSHYAGRIALNLVLFYNSLVHSFIIDVGDNFVIKAFTEEEMEEILEKENGQDPPEIEEELLAYINTFI
ncbi:hypothetical protein BC937DRAFT_91795 [Endogone sp. FLAS-F59071]|nr:hypothetical protein BC937DRAFT_91795 [Endogone sp. FLAS-F59071]|eukprot:RUS15933.1 hypothetical protein BC937DRAFT_91795 [Endogone sp. FLAS-F59071]